MIRMPTLKRAQPESELPDKAFGLLLWGVCCFWLVAVAFTTGCGSVGARAEQELSVNFQDDLREEGDLAIRRIATATGIQFRDSVSGVPVLLTPVVNSDASHQVCAGTFIKVDGSGQITRVNRVEISEKRNGLIYGSEIHQCLSRELDITHELLHIVVGDQTVSSETGVFREGAFEDILNEEVLQVVCSHTNCTKFNPEVAPARDL